MSLAKTLLKVAIGVAVAKGVSTLVKNSTANAQTQPGRGTRVGESNGLEDIMDGIGGQGRTQQPQSGGGLGDLLGQLSGQQTKPSRPARQNAPKGGLEDLLGSLGGGGTGQGGGLGDLLGQLTGSGRAPSQPEPQQGGGLGDLLGQLTGASGSGRGATQGGGLGDLLGQLTGGGTGGGTGGASGGGLGDLLGAILGGTAGGAAQAPAPTSRDENLAAALILRAMIQAVKADGELDREERQKLMKHAEGASQQEIAFINAELEHKISALELARQVPDGMEAQVYLMSLLAINLDNQNEAKYLDGLGKALSLEPREINALHDRAGAPHLYR